MNDNTEVYLDTSVLAKWYLTEANSDLVSNYIVNLKVAAISTLSKTEMRCLLARRKRMKEITSELEAKIYATFLEDIAQGHLFPYPVEDKHFESACHLISILPEHALRTLDALHLAVAEHFNLKNIATADVLFAKAAEQLGFKIDLF